MPDYFRFSCQFFDCRFHGRKNRGLLADKRLLEWPPSPLRAFQALVAAAARSEQQADSAFLWLESLPPPKVLAPQAVEGASHAAAVPKNQWDLVAEGASKYSKSREYRPETQATTKTIRPTLMVDGDTVHFLWEVGDPKACAEYVAVLSRVATRVTVLGLGVDLVRGSGGLISEAATKSLGGTTWLPCGATFDGLRIPRSGTLQDLRERHAARETFPLNAGELTAYTTVSYRRAGDLIPKPSKAFSLLRLDSQRFLAFDTAYRGTTVAGMMRYTTHCAAEDAGWTQEKLACFVLGHGEQPGAPHVSVGSERFSFLPLPSIESRGQNQPPVVGAVRRVLLTSDCVEEIGWASCLVGRSLIDEHSKQAVAVLGESVPNDFVVRTYTAAATSWATVTPMVLPRGLDPHKSRVEKYVRRAIAHAGYDQMLVENAELDWDKVGFWSGTELAGRYKVPPNHKQRTLLHVKLTWRDAEQRPIRVPGPVSLGDGRFYGLGLFAALD